MRQERIICQTYLCADSADFKAKNDLDTVDCQSDQVFRSTYFRRVLRGEFVRWGCDGGLRHEWEKVATKRWRFCAMSLYI